MADAWPDFTPVNLLTGFLGSGKTTLLRRMLADAAFADAAVLINEFGEIGLDHHLLERIDETMVVLQSGCVCCTVRGELSEAMRDLHSRRERGALPPFQRLVIESTGLADPFPIVSTIKADPVLRHHFRLGNVIATVDAANGLGQLAAYGETMRQAAIADHLVVTKTDIATTGASEALIVRLSTINPTARLVRAAEMEGAALSGLASESFDSEFAGGPRLSVSPDERAHSQHHHAHGEDARIQAFAIVVDEPLDWTAFGVWLAMLLNRHGARVLRVKAILNLVGEDNPVAVHGVQHIVHSPVHMQGWPEGDRRSRLVFIVDGLQPELIRRSLAAFTRVGGTR